MSRPNPIVLLLFHALLLAALGGVALIQGGPYVAKHEGDVLHLLQIVLRMADGEWPHLDFMTPIGALAFLPISELVKAGLPVGQAFLWAQVLLAAMLLLPSTWAAYSRFPSALAYLMAAAVMVLALALVHGEADHLVSISMHYNRWAWAVAYVVVVVAVLPGVRAQNGALDGALIGLGLAFLLMCKVTYFAGFAPVAALGLALRKDWRALGVAVVAGCLSVAVMTGFAGVAFWGAYLGDLLAVAGSEIRAQPGQPLMGIIGAPQYLGGSLTVLAAVIFLRQAGEEHLGLLLLLLAPGFFYVTYQNFGNDPQWLILLVLIVLAPRVDPGATNGFGWPLRTALGMTAVAAVAFAAPSFINLAYSPFRHMNVDARNYAPILARSERHGDLSGRVVRLNRVDGTMGLDVPGSGLEGRAELAKRDAVRTELFGAELPDCELRIGLVAWFEAAVDALSKAGYGDARIFVADVFPSLWLFGANPRLRGGAPWYYGGLSGIEDAEFVLVPRCAGSEHVRKLILEEIEARGLLLEPALDSALFVLARITR